MIEHIFLKQAKRQILVDRELLLKELAAAKKAGRGNDAFQIKAALTQYYQWVEGAEESSVTPEVKAALERDQYYHLFDLLKTKWAPAKFRTGSPIKCQISASLSALVRDLHLLIDKLGNANTSGGRTVHHKLTDSEADQIIARQIHLAQTNILIFINSLATRPAEVGDPGGELVDALQGSHFLIVLIEYLTEQGCNMQGAANLRNALQRIECTGKTSSPRIAKQ